MTQSKKQLTAEEIFCAREKSQKKKDKKKEAGLQAKEGATSAQLTNTSTSDKQDEDVMPIDEATRGGWVRTVPAETLNCISPNGEWVMTDSPTHWNKEELNVDWPWEGVPSKLLTQAPYAVNEHNFDAGFFALPQEVQVSNFNDNNQMHTLTMLDFSII
jgi:hypothetical protein